MSRVKMPHNNRVSGSAALRTNDIWSKTIGYNPYAAENEKQTDEIDENTASEQTAGLMLLAKMSNLTGSETRGACRRCGMAGHLMYQCRNNVIVNSTENDSDDDSSSSSGESSLGETAITTQAAIKANSYQKSEVQMISKVKGKHEIKEISHQKSKRKHSDDEAETKLSSKKHKKKHKSEKKHKKHKKKSSR